MRDSADDSASSPTVCGPWHTNCTSNCCRFGSFSVSNSGTHWLRISRLLIGWSHASWPAAAALSDLCSSVTPSPLSRLRPWLPPPELHALQYHHGQRRRLNARRIFRLSGTFPATCNPIPRSLTDGVCAGAVSAHRCHAVSARIAARMPPMRESGSLLVGLVGERLNLDSASRHPTYSGATRSQRGLKQKGPRELVLIRPLYAGLSE